MHDILSRAARRAGAALALTLGFFLGAGAMTALPAWAREAPAVADNPVIESRMMALASELRCLVCQNQTIADSHADLAIDLRQQIREQLVAGKSEGQIRDYMTERYGDFVLYKPPVKPTTMLLWYGPGVLLLVGFVLLVVSLRRRQRLADDAFDPEVEDAADPVTTAPT